MFTRGNRVTEPRIYVVQDDGRKDLSLALRYGDPVIIFKESFYPDTAGDRQRRVLAHALRVLASYEEGIDSVLLVGDLALVGIVTAAMVMLGHTKIRMIKFDRKRRDYYPIDVNFVAVIGSI